jgi:hypothetical protein
LGDTRPILVHDPGPAAPFTQSEFERELSLAAQARLSPCTSLSVAIRSASHATASVEQDGRNVVVTRTKAWCPDGAQYERQCHDPRLQARSTVRFTEIRRAERERRVAEVDLELNAVNYRWAVGSEDHR